MKTQKERVLDYLLKGHSLTQRQADRKWGIMRLGAVTFAINQMYGFKYIKSEPISVKNRYGQTVTVARYSI
jgi:hypothetical protein